MLIASAALPPPLVGPKSAAKFSPRQSFITSATDFPSFLPKQMESIRDPFARKLASRIQRLPVDLSLSGTRVMSSCIQPKTQLNTVPLVLLHGFDSSCFEWRYGLPLLEEAGFETWAVDVLGWGFSDLEKLPSCSVASKRDHLYQFWSSYIKRPMTLVGPSLGAAVAIDFAVNHPEAVDKLILIDASVYAEGTGHLATLPKVMAYAGIGRLHCLLPWWTDATVDFMTSGGYNVSAQIGQVKQKTLIIWGENDQIIDYKLAVRLHSELPNAIIRQIPECGHIPHVEKPAAVSKLISEFVRAESKEVIRVWKAPIPISVGSEEVPSSSSSTV
ncbi:alpha/beta hydrolase domain-containing protein VTE7 isoform X2 [Salvia miltiorrhiza]|uniref:alpha/beta hydrolase domain-containing protein VTE7 isoform X2 n=1 Tax=Salvia miltiorrhiza TaxID=226208 RepID=UPI0025ACEB00|nr:alpha/beta hydrolase domain-containing protein VTE7 isoform X2 [Salvia miltiorrhiza]